MAACRHGLPSAPPTIFPLPSSAATTGLPYFPYSHSSRMISPSTNNINTSMINSMARSAITTTKLVIVMTEVSFRHSEVRLVVVGTTVLTVDVDVMVVMVVVRGLRRTLTVDSIPDPSVGLSIGSSGLSWRRRGQREWPHTHTRARQLIANSYLS